MNEAITIADIRAASQRLKGAAVRTPLLESDNLNVLAGRRVAMNRQQTRFTLYHHIPCIIVTGADQRHAAR